MKQQCSMREMCSIAICMLLGSTVVLGVSSQGGRDSWISILLAFAMVVPFTVLYARLVKLMPEQSLFEMVENVFGKIWGKVFIVLFVWYGLSLGAMVLRNFSEYIKITMLPKTPEVIIMMVMILFSAYITLSGNRILGKISCVVLALMLMVVVVTVLMSLSDMKLENLLPILEHGPQQVFSGAVSIAFFPFGEIVLILVLMKSSSAKTSSYKVFLLSLAISALFLLVIFLRNLLILGEKTLEISYFPSYSTARIITLGSLLERLDAFIAIFITLTGFIKLAVCLMAATKGMTKLFRIRPYKVLVFPVTVFTWALCTILYRNIMEITEFIEYYPYYAAPFQVLLPLILWIGAEIQMKKRRNRSML